MAQADPQPVATPSRRRTSLTSALLVAALTELLVLGGAALAAFLTDWSGRLAWLVAPVVGVAVAMGKILLGEAGRARSATPPASPPAAPPPQQWTYPGPPPLPRPVRRRGTPIGVAILVVLLVVGGGGWAVAQGVRYATGYLTGNETGVERLVQSASVTDQGLTLAVDSVVQTAHFTRVGIVVTNGLGNTVTLPLFNNAYLSSGDGVSLEADAFRSDFGDTLAPGAVRRGTIVFVGHPPEGPTSVSFSFASVFEQGFDGPDSLTAAGITLRAVDEAAATAVVDIRGSQAPEGVDQRAPHARLG
jgi:hypothetical protein